QPQVNSALRYTIRATNVNPLQHDRGYSFENSFEVGGNLLYLLDRFAFTPGAVEGSLPGLPFFRGGRRDNRLTYKQYFRYVTDLRRYYPVARGRVLAWRFTGGFAQTFADSSLIPFDRRFYAGGGTSVRGWPLRSLGPGSTGNYFGGDILLEGSAELRARLIRNMFAADWSGALFTDAGNVWLGPHSTGDPDAHFRFNRFYKQIAVGSGIGLRIAWEYIVMRFDLAWKVYDPTYHVVLDPVTHTAVIDPATGEPIQEARGFLPDGLDKPVLHFGIGHSF
ncbi:MAG TPA: BamA/TamA family outer membrane protein, partial [Rhodothermales bacterium]|nr:BamA/TamA family outer membrane protein [Rhodothermales bacterium]